MTLSNAAPLRRLVLATALLPLLSAAAQVGQAPLTQASLPIVPLTTIGPEGSGFMADPQPVHLAAPDSSGEVVISGTTKAVLRCQLPVRPACFTWTPLQVNLAGIRSQLDAAGVRVTNLQNIDLFQNDAGAWHAAVTVGIQSARHLEHWTLVAHAHPVGAPPAEGPPLAWTIDTLLTGSLTDPVNGNYDGKYYVENGQLFLLYVRGLAPPPALRNAIVLQPMVSETQVAPAEATTLLTPGDRDGELNSEWYADTAAKLVEAPYLTVLNGKHLLVYSTGAYLTRGYKTGLAWSDALLPPTGRGRYRKVLLEDGAGLWGRPGKLEVRYLLQSERPRWPNFSGRQVLGPGVAAAVKEGPNAWWLYFNGFAPDDMPATADGRVEGDRRRPFGMRLHVAVPAGVRVADVSDAELALWVEPQ